ncbi:hypothetical protein [Thiomicrorhabdus aquaedulcis]|uniref:hypothetical protein n=1 Tax=Thiomicrorhabdus aquaedulcis TaxID=2211106 RepID=UPI000FD6FE00|nr:hypothetical protein [Thiomicrorhabdus aquaedulcis]
METSWNSFDPEDKATWPPPGIIETNLGEFIFFPLKIDENTESFSLQIILTKTITSLVRLVCILKT